MTVKHTNPAVAALGRLGFCLLLAVLISTNSAAAQESGPAQPDAGTTAGAGAPDIAQPAGVDAALGTGFAYQGRLQRSGAAYNGSCNLQFSLWDAASGGAQKGNTLTLNNVSVAGGLFTVNLDFGNQFTGDARWVQAAVQCAGEGGFTTLSPRQALSGAPYAFGLRPGAVISAASGTALSGVSASGWGVYGEGGGAGVVGVTSTQYNPAVYGEHRGTGGVGVQGKAVNGTGVAGESTAWFGTYGKSAQQSGVYGETAVAHSNGPAGVYGKSTGDGGIGVTGEAPLGNSWGVYGVSAAGAGVMGKATGAGVGVQGQSATGYGVYGQTGSATSYGVYGKNTAVGGAAGRFDGIVQITGGADLAERFEVSGGARLEPGTLLVIDENHPGQLAPSSAAYDARVAGIVSGAGGVFPGLTLHQAGLLEGNTAVAIAGRVYVKAEADSAPIKPGDLLTTSDVAGHAMKAADRERAYGAIIGKAMTGLDKGTGLVLVLVNLQ